MASLIHIPRGYKMPFTEVIFIPWNFIVLTINCQYFFSALLVRSVMPLMKMRQSISWIVDGEAKNRPIKYFEYYMYDEKFIHTMIPMVSQTLDFMAIRACFVLFCFVFPFLCMAVLVVAYGSSWVRGWISAAHAGLHHSHSNAGCKLPLWPML